MSLSFLIFWAMVDVEAKLRATGRAERAERAESWVVLAGPGPGPAEIDSGIRDADAICVREDREAQEARVRLQRCSDVISILDEMVWETDIQRSRSRSRGSLG